MGSGGGDDREAIVVALDALDAAFDDVAAMSLDALTHPELLNVLDRVEVLTRRLPVVGHRVLSRLAAEANPHDLGATSLANLLAGRARISRAEARRRVDTAKDLGPRVALTGEVLAPHLAKTAAAQAVGAIGAEHVAVIRGFFARLPDGVDYQTREGAEATLARIAADLTPEELRQAAERLMAYLHPDGEFSDAERARRRGITIGKQGADGMSAISGWLDPQARATWDAVLATWAAPGMCNPEDKSPCVDGTPSEEAVQSDQRYPGQRNHDALTAMGRALLASGQLGQHNGLPATIVVTTTLTELQSAAGQAVTGGGSRLPMSEVIRLASHAHHYLAVFDRHTEKPLYLGRSRRTATPGQRIVLHAKDRGCTHPGCTAPGYACQVHHATCDWADGGETNIDDLTFACGPHNRLVAKDGWSTRKRKDGTTEWIPPPHLDTGQPRINEYHHPENYLLDPTDD
jgi:Domain of unknown function (DUF222)